MKKIFFIVLMVFALLNCKTKQDIKEREKKVAIEIPITVEEATVEQEIITEKVIIEPIIIEKKATKKIKKVVTEIPINTIREIIVEREVFIKSEPIEIITNIFPWHLLLLLIFFATTTLVELVIIVFIKKNKKKCCSKKTEMREI